MKPQSVFWALYYMTGLGALVWFLYYAFISALRIPDSGECILYVCLLSVARKILLRFYPELR